MVVVHGVGEAVPGECVSALTDAMHRDFGLKASSGAAPDSAEARAFETRPYSEVHLLPQPRPEGRHPSRVPEPPPPSDPSPRPAMGARDQFPSFVRKATLADGGKVVFAELYWADLTRAPPGRVNAILSVFRIIFESHHFIDAMLTRKGGALTRGLRFLLLFASGFLRGPIAAFNGCLILIGLSFLVIDEAARLFSIGDKSQLILAVSVGTMAALLLVSLLYLWRYRRIRETEWADAFVATAVSSVLVMAMFGLARQGLIHLPSGGTSVGPDALKCSYANTLYNVLQGAWFIWALVVLVAYVIAFVLGLILFWRAKEARPAAVFGALGVVLIQAVLWVALISALVIPLLDQAETKMVNICGLGGFKWTFAVTVVFGAFFSVFALLVSTIRHWMARVPVVNRQTLSRWLPRLVINKMLLGIIVLGAFAHVAVYIVSYSDEYFAKNAILATISEFVTRQKDWKDLIYRVGDFSQKYKSVGYFFISGAALLLWYLFANGLSTIIHIARDLIDHHYSPKLGYSYYLFPQEWRNQDRRPRRSRVRHRLEILMRDLISHGGYDELVFIAHSQGSIILYDYLHVIDAGQHGVIGLKPHIVTLGSPLNYLYEHYFHEYGDLDAAIERLRPGLATWTNLYRVDDYIGGAIDSYPVTGPLLPLLAVGPNRGSADYGPLIVNEVMPPGGHIDYWSEKRVAEIVMGLINQPPVT